MTDWTKRIGWFVCGGGLFWFLAPALTSSPGQTAYSQIGGGAPSSDALLQVRSTLLPSGVEQLTVVDPSARSMAVYHIEPATAKIQLKSVRNLVWDLQMEHFNGQSPLPSELRQVQP